MAKFKCFLIKNIVCMPKYHYDSITLGELDFVTSTGRATDTSKLIVKNQWDDNQFGINFTKDSLLDNVVGVFSSRYRGGTGYATDYWLYYQFDEPQELTSFGLAMKSDVANTPDERWTSFDIYAGENVNALETHQHITCNFPPSNPTSLTYFNVSLQKIAPSYFGASDFLDVFSADESGSFSGTVTQGESGEPKVPLVAQVLLYDRMTNALMQRTNSDELGAYSFHGLDAGREYYAVTLHPSRTYNAAIQDGLKSGMTS